MSTRVRSGDLALIQPRILHYHHRPLIASPHSIQCSILKRIDTCTHFSSSRQEPASPCFGCSWFTTQEREGKVAAHHDRCRVCGAFPSFLPPFSSHPMSFSCPIPFLFGLFPTMAMCLLLFCLGYLGPTHSPDFLSPRLLSPVIGCQRNSYYGASLMAIVMPCR